MRPWVLFSSIGTHRNLETDAVPRYIPSSI